MNGRGWTPEEDAIMRAEYPETDTRDLAIRLDRTFISIVRRAHTLGLKKSEAAILRRRVQSGKKSGFKRGNVPWNKGLEGWVPRGATQSQFKKGSLPQTWVPVGTEIIDRDGYRHRKVDDTRIKRLDWRPVHRIVWEEHHGPVPKDFLVIFIDNDRSNCHIGNLAMVSRAELVYLNKNGYSNLDPSLRPAAIALAKLECAKNRAAKRMKEEGITEQDIADTMPPTINEAQRT